jgi:hypothetical protein
MEEDSQPALCFSGDNAPRSETFATEFPARVGHPLPWPLAVGRPHVILPLVNGHRSMNVDADSAIKAMCLANDALAYNRLIFDPPHAGRKSGSTSNQAKCCTPRIGSSCPRGLPFRRGETFRHPRTLKI